MTASIQTRIAADGGVLYLISFAPDHLPPVRPRDLAACWDAAHAHAALGRAGPTRHFHFAGRHGPIELTLTDADALAWAAAVEARAALATPYGLALCLRLLALIGLLSRSAASRAECRLHRGDAMLSRRLLGAAARLPLGPDGQFSSDPPP